MRNIESDIKAIKEAIVWSEGMPEADRPSLKKLNNTRRELKKIKYALDERPSVAAFGESQMGKSYLVSALMSTADRLFCVTSNGKEYNFISEINPSLPNSTIEATGVITRFSAKNDIGVSDGYLRAQLLTKSDIILILCEAFYNQIDYSSNNVKESSEINDILLSTVVASEKVANVVFSKDDIQDIEDYLRKTPSISKKCDSILKSDFFKFLLKNINNLENSQTMSLLKLLWCKNPELSKMFDDIFNVYKELEFSTDINIDFEAVVRKKGSLLDVARLDEMYGAPETAGQDYEGKAVVKLHSGCEKEVEKSFLSALISEITFDLPNELTKDRPFLNYMDILDFPGARRPEQIKEEKLREGKNSSTVLRRGKVTYLFNKYSASKRISALMLCHNNNQSAESTMGALINEWVNNNIGDTKEKRLSYVNHTKLPVLFIIGTWFNKDLELGDAKPGDDLEERWKRRFNSVLEKEVLKAMGDHSHWFNEWTDGTPFKNIFMLRDYKYSKMIFSGYDAECHEPEKEFIISKQYPDFMEDLKSSFINNDFVKCHFTDALSAWNESAMPQKDGTSRILEALSLIAPNVAKAREERFEDETSRLMEETYKLLEDCYHPENSDEQTQLAKKTIRRINIKIDQEKIKDSNFFSQLLDSMMIDEATVYQHVYKMIMAGEGIGTSSPMNPIEVSIYSSAGLSCDSTREDNVKKLCDYLGAMDEDECRSILDEEYNVSLDKILAGGQMRESKGEKIVNEMGKFWMDEYLKERLTQEYISTFSEIGSILNNLSTIYSQTNLCDKLIRKIDSYIKSIKEDERRIKIIANYLRVSFNKFIIDYGYNELPSTSIEELRAQNEKLRLGIDFSAIVETEDRRDEKKILSNMGRLEKIITSQEKTNEDNEVMMLFPLYKNTKKWEQKMRVGMFFTSHIPTYDIAANTRLKEILDEIKN